MPFPISVLPVFDVVFLKPRGHMIFHGAVLCTAGCGVLAVSAGRASGAAAAAGLASASCVASGLASAACVGAGVGAGVACTEALPQPAERSTRESRTKTASNFFIFISPYASCRLSIQAFSSRSEAWAEKRLPFKTFAPLASALIRSCPSPRLLPPEVKNGTIVLPEKS